MFILSFLLRFIDFLINCVARQQLRVRSDAFDPAFVKHHNAVGVFNRNPAAR